ncbi:MAG: T9SS type A sorting domain-containing protein, partial [Psychroserpens sp.]|nr:T9SS type A sorting domain-containing protein [Psychroserpens sp.]
NFLKNIYVGTPDVVSIEIAKKLDTGLTDPIAVENNCFDLAIKLDLGLSNNDIQDIEWEQVSTNFSWTFESDVYAIISPHCNGPIFFRVRIKNDCGWSEWQTQKIDIDNCKSKCNKDQSGNITSETFTIYPVPADTNLNIQVNGEGNDLLENGNSFVVKLFNSNGWLVYESEVISTFTTIDISDLSSGIYSLVLIIEGEVETHTIVIE